MILAKGDLSRKLSETRTKGILSFSTGSFPVLEVSLAFSTHGAFQSDCCWRLKKKFASQLINNILSECLFVSDLHSVYGSSSARSC
jgi:hypothetical protein